MTQTTKPVGRINMRRKPAAATPTDAPAVKPARRSVTMRASSPILTAAMGIAVKFFIFVEGARPTSGVRLFAHTDAALRFLGMAEMHPVRKNAAVALMGGRAIKHHTDVGNMQNVADSIKLTKQGYEFFKARVDGGKIDGKLSAAYSEAIAKGKTTPALGIKDNHILPVGMILR